MITIIPYNNNYRDDMLFCYLLAKESLGKVPKIQEDLFSVEKNYFDKGDMFWLAIDENNRVVGMIGTKTISSTVLWLKRLFVKPNFKRQGIGTRLLNILELFAKEKGMTTLHTRFPDDYIEASAFYPSNGFIEIERSEGLRQFCENM